MTMSSHELGNEPEVQSASWQTRLGAWLTPTVFVLLWILPLPLEPKAHRLSAIVGAVLVAWVTEVIPIAATALLIAPALVVCGIAPAKKAFSAYADPILFLFVGSFFAARAMTRHGLDRRLASSLLSLPFIQGAPSRVRLALTVGAMLASMWISNTGTTAILLPVFLGVLPLRDGVRAPTTFAAGTLLTMAHGSTTGGIATLVGTPPNAITARILDGAGARVGFLDWMKLGVPMALALTALVYLVVGRLLPAERDAETTSFSAAHGPLSRAEKVTAVSFALAVIGWITPDLAHVAGAPFASALSAHLEPGAVALMAASILFMVPAEKGGERVLTWRDAVQIEWGLIFLFGGGIALGEAMFETGLAGVLGEGFLRLTGVTNLWTLTFAMIVSAVVLTEICSNTAAANMLVPLAIGAAAELGVSPIPPALGVGIAASCGFMLPVATGPNAIAYGTGLVSAHQMIRVGVWLDILSTFVIFTLLYLLCPMLGFV